MWTLICDGAPQLCAQSVADFRESATPAHTPHTNFLKACQWSPDGTCLLTASDDRLLRIFALPSAVVERALEHNTRAPTEGPPSEGPGEGAPELRPALTIKQGEAIYDMDWYPAFDLADPVCACFATTSRGHPVHLWDVATGRARTTYRTYDAADAVTSAHCIKFHPDMTRLLGGLKGKVVVWDLARPGRECMTVTTRAGDGSQRGIISCLALSPCGTALAAGAFSGDVGVYDSASGDLALLLQGHTGGVTQTQFSRCGNFLYTAARQDTSIICWDVRHTHERLYTLSRDDASPSNQRVAFDIEPCGRHLLSGNTRGTLQTFDLAEGAQCASMAAADDTLNGVSVHPFAPLLATASGHRRFAGASVSDGDSDGDGDEPALGPTSNRLAIWAVASKMDDVSAEDTPADGASSPHA